MEGGDQDGLQADVAATIAEAIPLHSRLLT
jgi:hypothetical protein